MHGDAVHADLNGVSCRPVSRTVTEVQLDGLHCMDGRSEARKETILLGQQGFFFLAHLCWKVVWTQQLTGPVCQIAG